MGQQGLAFWCSRRRRGVAEQDFRKDIIIDMFNEAGQLVLSYKVFRCWVSNIRVRDTAVTEPTEPGFGN